MHLHKIDFSEHMLMANRQPGNHHHHILKALFSTWLFPLKYTMVPLPLDYLKSRFIQITTTDYIIDALSLSKITYFLISPDSSDLQRKRTNVTDVLSNDTAFIIINI